MTKEYVGFKRVLGFPQEKDGQSGYGVIYPDGYQSWSPKEVFEKAYRETGNHSITTDKLTFSEAIELLKQGKKLAREGWNGKGMFIYYVPENKYPASGNKLGTMSGIFEDDLVPYGAYLAMKTAQNNVVPWLASQTDVLAEDWQIAE